MPNPHHGEGPGDFQDVWADGYDAGKRAVRDASRPKRDWMLAVAKVHDTERTCRICGASPVEAAHVVGRSRDQRVGNKIVVNPESVVALCRDHHREYDARTLDLLPYLTVAEQAQAVEDAGGIVAALRRVSGRQAGEMAA